MECACACVCAWRTAGIADEARPTVWEVSATVSGSPASPPGGLGDVDLDPMALDSTPPPQPSDTNPAPSSAIRGRAGGVEGLPPSLSPNERELEVPAPTHTHTQMHMHTNMHRRTSTHQRTHKAHAHTRTRAHSAERRETADGLGVAEQPQGGVGTDKTMGDEARPTFFWEVSATVRGSPASGPGGRGDVDPDPMALDSESTPPPTA